MFKPAHTQLLMVLFTFMTFSGNAYSETTHEIWCWDANKYDKDGDGYAKLNAAANKREELTVPFSEKKTCPAGYVKARGDCNDRDADVHPRQREVYGNGVDDNCNGLEDEPVIQNYPLGNENDLNSFKMFFFVNDPDVIEARRNPTTHLRIKIRYQKLSDTGHTYSTGLKKISKFVNAEPLVYGEVELNNLEEATVYRAKIQFYKVPSDTGIIWPIGDASPWYYTTTEGRGKIGKARTAVLLQGFFEHYEGTRQGLVGYKGFEHPDGTRYKATLGENWCSEFYSWLIKHKFKGIMSRSIVDYVKNYFNNRDAGVENPSHRTIKEDMRRGDYLAINTTNDDEADHSAMFLAYDRYQNEVYTLDGNISGSNMSKSRKAGNEIFITSRSLNRMLYWGQLNRDMVRD